MRLCRKSGIGIALSLGLCLMVTPAWADSSVGTVERGQNAVQRHLDTAEHGNTVWERAFLAHAALSETPIGTKPSAEVLSYLDKVSALSASSGDLLDKAVMARVKAEAAVMLADVDADLAKRYAMAAEADLSFLDEWLELYGQKIEAHRRQEPAWIKGRPDVVAQAVLGWCNLEMVASREERRQKIDKFCLGLRQLALPEQHKYPFGAHMSRVTAEGKPYTYSVPNSDTMVAGESLIIAHQYCAAALARAGKLLHNKDFLDSAEIEGRGLLTHLALLDSLLCDYAPRPELEVESPLGVVAVVENLLELKRATGNAIYGDLAGCAAINAGDYSTGGAVPRAVKSWTELLLRRNGLEHWIGARDYRPSFNGVVVELENGKAVQKSFVVHEVSYPGGTPGKLAVVGRDNMFWMRFDVDREDSYYFYLCFLKSDASGGLVSVNMRIDGDKIFEVSLDGATDTPFVDAELVAGPRVLRQGPHSFGIRFSGLLMRSPAWLDVIMVEPAVQRRWLELADGTRVMLLNSIADTVIKTRIEELEHDDSSVETRLWNGNWCEAEFQTKSDKHKRVWIDMPASGLAKLSWKK